MGIRQSDAVPSAPPLSVDELHLLRGLLVLPSEALLDLIRELSAFWPCLSRARAEVDGQPVEALREEYLRLFIGGESPPLCPPFASAYLAPGSQSAVVVARLYAAAALPLTNVPPDYIGSELNLLAELMESEHDLGPELLGETWNHMAAWVPQFAATLRMRAHSGLYQGIGERLGQLFA